MTDLSEIYNEWQNNPTFRDDFKKNPMHALQNAGFEVCQEDLDKILAMFKIDKSKNDKLDDRINR